MALQAFRYLLLASFLCLLSPVTSLAANVFWDAAVSGDWDDPTKWTGGAVPQAGDDVFIDVAGTYTVTLDHANVGVNSLTVGGASGEQTLELRFRTLTLDAASEIGANGILQMRSATINGAGNLDLKGQTRLLQTNQLFNICTNFAGARIVIEGSTFGNSDLRVENELENRGAIVLTNTDAGTARFAALSVRSNDMFINGTGATFTVIEGARSGLRQLTVEAGAEVQNFGSIHIAHATTFDPGSNAEIDNRGTILATGGTLTVSQVANSEFQNPGAISVGAGHSVVFTNGRFVHDGGQYTGTGILNFSFVTVNGAGTFDPEMDSFMRSCTFNSKVENSQMMSLSGTNTFNALLENTLTGVLGIIGGTNGNAELRANAKVENRGLIRLTNEHPTIARTAIVRLNNAAAHFVNETGASIQIVNGTVAGQRILVNGSGSEFENFAEITGDADYIIDSDGTSEFRNAGTLSITSSNVELQNQSQAQFFNNGAINVSAGQQFSAANGKYVQQGGTLSGAGSAEFEFVTLNGNVEFVNELSSVFRACTFNAAFKNEGVAILRALARFNARFLNTVNARTIVQASANGNGELRIEDRGINQGLVIYENVDNNTARTARISVQATHRFTNATGAEISIRQGLSGGLRDILVENDGNFLNFGEINNNVEYTIDLNNGVFDNNADLTLTNATVTISQTAQSQFTNSGVIAVATGLTLSFNNGALGSDGGRIEGGGLLSLEFADLEGDSFITNILTDLRSADVDVAYENRLTTNLFGTNTFNKPLVNGSGATLNVVGSDAAGAALARINSSLKNFGLIRISSSHPLLPQTASIQVNTPGSSFENCTGATIQFLSGSNGGARQITLESGKVLRNFGTIENDVEAIIDNNNGTVANHGLLRASGANLDVQQAGLAGRVINSGQINISPGRLLEISNGTFESAGGTVQGGGELLLEFGDIDGASPFVIGTPTRVRGKTVKVPLVNNSTFRINGLCTFEEAVENATGATLEVEGNANGGNARMEADKDFSNFGTFELLNSDVVSRSVQIDIAKEFLNTSNATIKFGQGVAASTRRINILTGAELLNFGMIESASTATIDNQSALFIQQGDLQVSGGTLTVDQTVTAELRLGGQPHIASNATLFVDDGNVRMKSPQLSGGGLLEILDAEILGNQTFTNSIHTRLRESSVNPPVVNEGLLGLRGDIDLLSFFENTSTATLALESTADDLSSEVRVHTGMLNSGILLMDNLDPGVAFETEIILEEGVTITSATGATINALATVGGSRAFTFVSTGTLQSFGDIFVASGATLRSFGFEGSRIVIGTTATAGPPAIISGFGIIDLNPGLLQVFASVTPGASAGALQYQGSFTVRNRRSVVEIELGGTTPGTQHDQFNVTGTMRFGGILDIQLIDGFVPQAGDEFVILTYANHVGEFEQIRGLDLGNGEFLTAEYRSDKLVLFISSETIVDVDVYMHGLWNGSTHKRSAAIVELREGADLATSTLASRTSALIDVNGRVRAEFESVQSGDYWVIVRHGGNFAVASKIRQTITQGEINSVDFTNTDDVFNGDNAMFTVLLNGTNYDVVRTGDFNADQSASADDFIQFFIPNFGVVNPGQVPALD